MSVLLIAGYLSEIGVGAALTTGLETVGVSGAAGAFAGEAGSAIIAGKVGEQVDGKIVEAYNYLVPPETREKISETKDDLFSAYTAQQSGDLSYFINKEKHRQRLADAKTKEEKEAVHKEFHQEIHGNTNLPDPTEVGKIISDTSNELSKTNNDPIRATANVIANHSESLTHSLLGYLSSASVPDTDEYRRIAEVYNGRSITKDSFRKDINPENGLIRVFGIDETGVEYSLEQTTGIVLPAVPGTVFVGPRSPNNDVPANEIDPETGEERLMFIDGAAYFHDLNYGLRGSLDRFADLSFVSRLAQNMDRVLPKDRAFVQSTIVYFANASLVLGTLKGSISTDDPTGIMQPGTQPNQDLDNNYFSLFVSKDDIEYTQKEKDFYQEIEQHIIENAPSSPENQLKYAVENLEFIIN